jgi:hypothetical protein
MKYLAGSPGGFCCFQLFFLNNGKTFCTVFSRKKWFLGRCLGSDTGKSHFYCGTGVWLAFNNNAAAELAHNLVADA